MSWINLIGSTPFRVSLGVCMAISAMYLLNRFNIGDRSFRIIFGTVVTMVLMAIIHYIKVTVNK